MKVCMNLFNAQPVKRTTLALMGLLAVAGGCVAQQNDTAKTKCPVDSIQNSKNIVLEKIPEAKTIPDYDISLRTFQVMDGSNTTMIGIGSGINKDFARNGYLQLYGTALAGYDFAHLQPCIGGFGTIDYIYPNQRNNAVKMSAAAYGELMASKEYFKSRVALTPLKINANLGKDVFLSFAPSAALHFINKTVKPMVETFTTLRFPLSKKNKNISGALQFRTTDMITHNFNGKNMELRAGIKYKF